MAIPHLILTVLLLLASARLFGRAFQRLGQPAVIGEIFGGLFLGPTFLGFFAPEFFHFLFQSNPLADWVLPGLSQIGLALLMFCSGLETRLLFRTNERKTALAIAAAGMVIPFGLGFLLVHWIPVEKFLGTAEHPLAFALVFAIAVAVTSIPVISRILRDLGVLESSFSRIVLSAAVIEDIVLYAILGLAVSLAIGAGSAQSTAGPESGFLLASFGGKLAAQIAVTGIFLAGSLTLLPPLLLRCRPSFSAGSSLLLLLCLYIVIGFALGVPLMLSAFAAGLAASVLHQDIRPARERIQAFSFSFFIPLYFALTGLKLNLLHHFDPAFFLFFFAIGTLIKAGSVYAGAAWAGETRQASLNYAVAMNARGGPGIVLASVALSAGIINLNFYAMIIMLSVVSSLLAAIWLGSRLRNGFLDGTHLCNPSNKQQDNRRAEQA
jgi:Kef-type K+ transport system membrane component KefB